MTHSKINSEDIKDWSSFHFWFQKQFSFPNYYGKNMDAWIDCMDDVITESTVLDFGDCRLLKQHNPDIINAITECSAFVNFRKIERGEVPVLIMSMFV